MPRIPNKNIVLGIFLFCINPDFCFSQIFKMDRAFIGVESSMPVATFSKYVNAGFGFTLDEKLGDEDLSKVKFYTVLKFGHFFQKSVNWDGFFFRNYFMPLSFGFQYETSKLFLGTAYGVSFLTTNKVDGQRFSYCATVIIPRAGIKLEKSRILIEYNRYNIQQWLTSAVLTPCYNEFSIELKKIPLQSLSVTYLRNIFNDN